MSEGNQPVVGNIGFYPTYPVYPQQSFPTYQLKPHICPVCNGKTTVPNGFYNTLGASSSTNSEPETCRSCNGKGIIWG